VHLLWVMRCGERDGKLRSNKGSSVALIEGVQSEARRRRVAGSYEFLLIHTYYLQKADHFSLKTGDTQLRRLAAVVGPINISAWRPPGQRTRPVSLWLT
jgi:hypothetical protein